MIAFFSLAIIQLFDKSLQKTLWIGIVGSAVIFLIIWLAVGHTLSQIELFSPGRFFGIFDWVFVKIADIFGGAIIFIVTWFLFPSVVTLIITFFLENVIQAVEKKHYPNLQETRRQGITEIGIITLKFTLLSIILNILVLPFYIGFFFLGPLNLLIFYALNGYLLGREYFELVAYRRLEPDKAGVLYRSFQVQVFIAGVISAFIMTIPIVNMVGPIILAATMVHLIQRCKNRKNAADA